MSYRHATKEEKGVLNLLGSTQGELVLVPVRFHGQERFALGMITEFKGQPSIRLLAICINPTQDDRCLTDMEGDLPEVGGQNLLN